MIENCYEICNILQCYKVYKFKIVCIIVRGKKITGFGIFQSFVFIFVNKILNLCCQL